MSQFHSHGLRAGQWSGTLTAPQAPPRVVVTHLGQIVAAARIRPAGDAGDRWLIEADLPVSLLSDGLHSLALIADDGSSADQPLQPGATRLAQLAVMAGAVLSDDLLAELEHLRAELDMLKREFRRFAAGG